MSVSSGSIDTLKAALVDSALDCMILLDDQGRIVVWNPVAVRLFGYTAQEALGQDLHQLLAPVADREAAGKGLAKFQKTGRGPVVGKTLEFTALCKDGIQIPVEVAASAVFLDGRWFAAGVVRDVSERRLVEDKLRTSLREKEILLKEIHHRVKNNLQVISGLLGLQAQYVKDPEDYHLFAESRDRIRSMALVHEELSRSGEFAIVNLREYVTRLVRELLGSMAAGKDISLGLFIDEVQFPIDLTVPCGLIINELVTNALKHGFAGRTQGRLEVYLSLDSGQVSLSVHDDGTGFPVGVDMHNAESLGLELVTNLVTQRKGTVELIQDKGTTVVISFPSS